MNLLSLLFLSFLVLILFIILFLNIKIRNCKKYFEKQGIPYFGVGYDYLFKLIFGFKSAVEIEEEIYQKSLKTKSPIVGIADFAGQKVVYITDLDLLRQILVKDFDHFTNRRLLGTLGNNYLEKMLVFLENEHWKETRGKLSPSFTTGKIRKMFQIFKISSERLDVYLKNYMETSKNNSSMDIDFVQIFPKYTLDVIASCAFGIDSKSFEVSPEQSSVFEQMAQQFAFRFSWKMFSRFFIIFVAPKVAGFLGISDGFAGEPQDYLSGVIKNVMKIRRETGERREDFLQLMMDAQEGLMKADEETNQVLNGTGADEKGPLLTLTSSKEAQKRMEFGDDHVIANALLFLMAGFDGTQAVLLFTIYALALEPEVQEKLYEEARSVLSRHEDGLSYEAILEMTYLDMVMNESMRRYTPNTRLDRTCTKDYLVPGTNFVIEKGFNVIIPAHGIHQDQQYYSDPKKFFPERFSQENKASRHPYAFIPFGHGPRNCIGMRFALIKLKAAIAQLVYKFKFAPCSETKIPMEFDRSQNVRPKGSMWLNVTRRDV